jgi:hypothetical protein
VLKGQVQLPSTNPQDSPPPSQPHVFLVSSRNSGAEQLRRVNQPVILHLPIDATCTTNAAAAAAAAATTIPEMLHTPSFIGLHVYCNNNNNNDLDSAQAAGTALQQVLRNCPTAATAACSVSLDLELHLALLRMNALPKDPGPVTHGDSYNVFMPEGGSLLIDYIYDHDNPFGGADPLKCPTKEVLIETPPTSPSLQRSLRLAAAYTAVRGQQQQNNNNKEVSASFNSAAIIAASVATILGDDDDDNSNTSTSSMPTWNMIRRAVQLSSHIRNFGVKEQVPGFMRQKYKEYGHK